MQRDALAASVLSAGTRPCADGCRELPLPIRGGRSLTGLCPAAAYERAAQPLPRDSPPPELHSRTAHSGVLSPR